MHLFRGTQPATGLVCEVLLARFSRILAMPKDLRFGIVGLGLMGREFASAAARWIHLNDFDVRPVIVAVCDANENALGWVQIKYSNRQL